MSVSIFKYRRDSARLRLALPAVFLAVGLGLSGCAGGADTSSTTGSSTISTQALLVPTSGSLDQRLGGAPDARGSTSNHPLVENRVPISVKNAAAKSTEHLTASATPGSDGYRIGPLDVLELSVFKVPELSRVVQVADSGTANFPLTGEIQVAGRTPQDVERDLAAKLGAKYLQRPQVTVFVREYNSQRVTIEGAVKKPGVLPIRGRHTLLQFIAMAEGVDPNAGTEIVVFRQVEGKRTAARFDLDDIRSGKTQDPVMQSGDVIVVPTSITKQTVNNVLKVLPAIAVFAPLL